MFKALYSHVNNVTDKYLQIYSHILLYLQWVKNKKNKTKAAIKLFWKTDDLGRLVIIVGNSKWVKKIIIFVLNYLTVLVNTKTVIHRNGGG